MKKLDYETILNNLKQYFEKLNQRYKKFDYYYQLDERYIYEPNEEYTNYKEEIIKGENILDAIDNLFTMSNAVIDISEKILIEINKIRNEIIIFHLLQL